MDPLGKLNLAVKVRCCVFEEPEEGLGSLAAHCGQRLAFVLGGFRVSYNSTYNLSLSPLGL